MTVTCVPVLVTEVDSFTGRQFAVVHTDYWQARGWLTMESNDPLAVVTAGSVWTDREQCEPADLPARLPRARLRRVPDLRMSCAVPGRRLMLHVRKRSEQTVVTLRVLPHGTVLIHAVLERRTVRPFVSRYALQLCDAVG